MDQTTDLIYMVNLNHRYKKYIVNRRDGQVMIVIVTNIKQENER